jgi:hypothetical protein
VQKLSPNEFEVSFLRKKGNTKFCYPSVPDLAAVDFSDIVALQPPPSETGTDRTKQLIILNSLFPHLMLNKVLFHFYCVMYRAINNCLDQRRLWIL